MPNTMTEQFKNKLIDLIQDQLKTDKIDFNFSHERDVLSISEAIQARGRSYCNGLRRYLNVADLDEQDTLFKLNKQVDQLEDEFIKACQMNLNDRTYLAKKFNTLFSSLTKINKIGKNELYYFEALTNMKEHPIQVTVSYNSDDPANYLIQIDKPLNRFSNLSKSQKQEYAQIYLEFLKKQEQETSEEEIETLRAGIFKQAEIISKDEMLPHVEASFYSQMSPERQRDLINTLHDVAKGLDPCIGIPPQIEKSDRIGLRNFFESSVLVLNNELNPMSFSPPTLRSTNINNGYSPTEIEANIEQIIENFNKRELNRNDCPWVFNPEHQPTIFLQTLVRPIIGGDRGINRNKEQAVTNLLSRPLENRPKYKFAVSNYNVSGGIAKGLICLFDTPAKLIKNDNGTISEEGNAICSMLDDFYRSAVSYEPNGISISTTQLPTLFEQAKAGTLQQEQANEIIDKELKNTPKAASLKLILASVNAYQNVSLHGSRSQFNLFKAALEEIIVTNTGHCFHSSCKSGKDREGLMKLMKASILEYQAKYKTIPMHQDHENMSRLYHLMANNFVTHHQNILAGKNAQGCNGLKSIKDVLPKEVLADERVKETLKAHSWMANLNKGKAKIGFLGQLKSFFTQLWFYFFPKKLEYTLNLNEAEQLLERKEVHAKPEEQEVQQEQELLTNNLDEIKSTEKAYFEKSYTSSDTQPNNENKEEEEKPTYNKK